MTAWLTIRNSSEEDYFDPYYEQLQYIGDTRIEALISIYVSGDDRLMRKAIRQFDDSRITDWTLPKAAILLTLYRSYPHLFPLVD